ncbi:permease [Psychrosphaera sp. B3R10]|uniref:ABC transporter permease n=1 Tax=unclassified Psychrosphaera TaxID=2641570 RepID=UPI001C07F729|nr:MULTISPECIES: FtsX-like permease family protein [unclassified Psychrosphaera]MBU2881980.1 permease [Psychrosphaera sp. I2R16]MBU2988710.1 permease [Psychrosphaera sp. B3R10]
MLNLTIPLAWHYVWQEFRQPHQLLLRWVQAVLMVFIVTLSLASNTIQTYLEGNLQNLLGADAVLTQKANLTKEQITVLAGHSENVVKTSQIDATLTFNTKWQRTKLKAVGRDYPLQGQLLTSTSVLASNDNLAEVTHGGPKLGNIWLDSRLFASLSAVMGDVINVGEHRFVVSRLLVHEPDRLMEGHNVAMRAIINIEDMEKLAFAADLIQYRYLVSGTKSQINQLMQWQKQSLPAAKIHHKQGAHPLALFWQRTENFLGLASIILFFMAAIAIEQLAQLHLKKEQFFSAICMSLGASKVTGLQLSILKWFFNILLLIPVVVVISGICHWLVVNWLSTTFPAISWQLEAGLMAKTITTSVLLFAVFHTPVWLTLWQTSVPKLFQQNRKSISLGLVKLCALVVLVLVAFKYSDNGLLTLMLVGSIFITILLLVAISWAALTFGEKATQRFSGLIPFSLFMMKQRLLSKSTQILGIGLSTFLLLFTLMLLRDLGDTMVSYQRTHDGNVMISQADQQQMNAIKEWSMQHGIDLRQTKPYLYAKAVKINDQALDDFSQKPSDSLATLSRSIRLHWSQTVPDNNRVVQGKWWSKDTDKWQQISLEEEVMTDLGLTLGDTLTFIINQQSFTFTIAASHVYQPGAGSITFWVQMPATAVKHINAPHYNMASLEMDDDQWPLLGQMWRQYPTIRMVSLGELTKQFDNILAMITKVISGFAVMIIFLAVTVILSSINAFENKEKKKNCVIMSFGFLKKTCWQLNVIEWLITAFIIAIGAIAGTYITGMLIYQSQFSLVYQPNVTVLCLTLVVILSTVTLLGVYASRHSLKSSVKQLMADV